MSTTYGRALLLDRLPIPIDALKENAPDSYLALGEWVFDQQFLSALLRFGSYDRYYCLHDPWSWPDALRPDEYFSSPRLVRLGVSEFDQLKQHEQLVLFTSSLALHKYAPLRLAAGRPWPICGLAHHFASGNVLSSLAMLLSCQLRHYDAVVASTPTSQQALIRALHEVTGSKHLRDVGPPRVRVPVVHLGADAPGALEDRQQARQTLGLSAGDVAFLSFGRWSPRNKVDPSTILSAFLDPAPIDGSVVLLLAGDDTEHGCVDALRASLAGRRFGHRVHLYANPTSSLKHRLFAAADVFVALSTSFEETFGLVVAEAMLSGLPVIASDWDGYRALVTADSTGYLVPTRAVPFGEYLEMVAHVSDVSFHLTNSVFHDIRVLREAASTLARDGARRSAMGRAARVWAEEHVAWPSVIREWEDLWEGLLESASSEAIGDDNTPPFRYRSVFEGYPTSWLAPDANVRLDPAKFDSALEALAYTRRYARCPDCQLEIARRVLDEIGRLPTCSLQACIAVSRAKGMSSLAATAFAATLFAVGGAALCGDAER